MYIRLRVCLMMIGLQKLLLCYTLLIVHLNKIRLQHPWVHSLAVYVSSQRKHCHLQMLHAVLTVALLAGTFLSSAATRLAYTLLAYLVELPQCQACQ